MEPASQKGRREGVRPHESDRSPRAHGDATHRPHDAGGLVPFDVADVVALLLSQSLTLLPVDHAAVLLENEAGALRLMAATSEKSRRLETLKLKNEGGPGIAAFTSRQVVEAPRLGELTDRWPFFVQEAQRFGINCAYAIPLRADEVTIGALTLLSHDGTQLSKEQLAVGRALATMATIGIVNNHSTSTQTELSAQLQKALDSRIVIEQAKGIIAAQRGIDVSSAFDVLRKAARSSGRTLPGMSADVVANRVPPPQASPTRRDGDRQARGG